MGTVNKRVHSGLLILFHIIRIAWEGTGTRRQVYSAVRRIYKLPVNLTLDKNDSPSLYWHREFVLLNLLFVYQYKHSIKTSPRKYYNFFPFHGVLFSHPLCLPTFSHYILSSCCIFSSSFQNRIIHSPFLEPGSIYSDTFKHVFLWNSIRIKGIKQINMISADSNFITVIAI